MKLLLVIVAVLAIAGSFFADYKWKQWVANQKAARNPDHGGPDNGEF